MSGISLGGGVVDELFGLLPGVGGRVPVPLALEELVLVVPRPVVGVPLLEGVAVHGVGRDVAIQDRLLLNLEYVGGLNLSLIPILWIVPRCLFL